MKTKHFSIIPLFSGLYFLLFTSTSGANTHEHLASWPSYDAITSAYQQIYQQPLSTINFNWLAAKGENMQGERIITALWGSTVWRQLSQQLPGRDISQVSVATITKYLGKLLNISPGKVLEGFFRFNGSNHHNVESYLAIEDVRNSLFKQLRRWDMGKEGGDQYRQFFLLACEKTIQRQRDVDVHRLDLSIGAELLGPEIGDLAQLLQRYQVQSAFFLAYPRSKLIGHDEETFRQYFQLLTSAYQQKMIAGIDLAGSIDEKNSLPLSAFQQQVLAQRLELLFHWAQNHQGRIKIHAFESGRTGDFYQILFHTMEHFQGNAGPIDVTWGHVNQVEVVDVQRLLALQQHSAIWQWHFDANFHSAQVLHGLSSQYISDKISMLWAHGIPVSLGTDGQGIWQPAKADLQYAFDLLGSQNNVPFFGSSEYFVGKKLELESIQDYVKVITQERI